MTETHTIGTCCFLGHRDIEDSDSLCLEIVSELKSRYPHIKRIYVRAEYEYISEQYKRYLLQSYDDTYYPEKIKNAHKAVYIERNREMIEKSDVCVFYYSPHYKPNATASGTALAYSFAKNQLKEIINIYK